MSLLLFANHVDAQVTATYISATSVSCTIPVGPTSKQVSDCQGVRGRRRDVFGGPRPSRLKCRQITAWIGVTHAHRLPMGNAQIQDVPARACASMALAVSVSCVTSQASFPFLSSLALDWDTASAMRAVPPTPLERSARCPWRSRQVSACTRVSPSDNGACCSDACLWSHDWRHEGGYLGNEHCTCER